MAKQTKVQRPIDKLREMQKLVEDITNEEWGIIHQALTNYELKLELKKAQVNIYIDEGLAHDLIGVSGKGYDKAKSLYEMRDKIREAISQDRLKVSTVSNKLYRLMKHFY